MPFPSPKEDAPPEGALPFAALVDVAESLPAKALLPDTLETASFSLPAEGAEVDAKPANPHSAIDTPASESLAMFAEADTPRNVRGAEVSQSQTSLPATAQDRGIPAPQANEPPKLRPNDPSRALPDAPDLTVGNESRQRAKPALPSAAQSLIEGRILHLPDVAVEKRAEVHSKRAEHASEAARVMPPVGHFNAPAPTSAMPTTGAGAPAVPVPDLPSQRGRGAPERTGPSLNRTHGPDLNRIAPDNVNATKLPDFAVALGIKGKEVDVGSVASKVIEQEGLQGILGQDRHTPVTSISGGSAAAGPETARHAAQQIATAIIQGNGKSTEIALNPEELGRVRLKMTAVDGAMTLVILADRPETQELMRRHIDVLAQEFRALGYDSISFSFSAEGQSGRADNSEGSSDEGQFGTVQHVETEELTAPPPTTGLDLRL
jgi:hypothetical protein